MKKLVRIFSFILAVSLLTACSTVTQSSSSVPESVLTSSSAQSSSSKAESIAIAPPESVSIESTIMSESEIIVETGKGLQYLVQFNFPQGIYHSGSNIYQENESTVPDTVLEVPRDEDNKIISLKIGWVYPTNPNIELLDDSTLRIHYDNAISEYTLSNEENLPNETYYFFEDILAITYEGVVPGSHQLYKTTAFHIPIEPNFYICLCFFHNTNSIGAKAYFENIINQITVKKIT